MRTTGPVQKQPFQPQPFWVTDLNSPTDVYETQGLYHIARASGQSHVRTALRRI